MTAVRGLDICGFEEEEPPDRVRRRRREGESAWIRVELMFAMSECWGNQKAVRLSLSAGQGAS